MFILLSFIKTEKSLDTVNDADNEDTQETSMDDANEVLKMNLQQQAEEVKIRCWSWLKFRGSWIRIGYSYIMNLLKR